MNKLSLLYRIGALILVIAGGVLGNTSGIICGTLWIIIAYLEEMKNE